MITLTRDQRRKKEMAEAARRYGEERFEAFASAKGYEFNAQESGYALCAVRRNSKRSICEVLPVWRISDKSNPKAVLTVEGWFEFGWLISLKGIICYRPKKSNFRVYPLAHG